MREFSSKEQSIIKNRLMQGATLPGLFSDQFLSNGKLMIHVDHNGHHKFEFFSDTLSARAANEELVDTINLLMYLDKEGLITKYPPAATSLRDFEVDQQISIGNSTSTKSEVYLLIRESQQLVDFLKNNDNYFFQANEPLRVLCNHNFLTLQERQFSRTIRITNRGQWISVGIALATLFATGIINGINWKRNDKSAEVFRSDLVIIREQMKIQLMRDSIKEIEQSNMIIKLNQRLDSIRLSSMPKKNSMPKPLSLKK